MGILQAFKMSLKSMLGNKGRTMLTMLGVIIGVATFITLVALGEGTKKSISDSIESMGTNLINITITGRNSNRNITYDDLTNFAEQNSNEIEAIAPTVSGSATVKYEDKSWDASFIGTSPEYETVRNTGVQSGRFITQMDVDCRLNVVVMGTGTINNLFSRGVNPIDQKVKLNGEIFKIVGILQERASGASYSADDQVIIPITVSRKLMDSAQIRNFSVQARTSDLVDAAMFRINQFMLKTYTDDSLFRVQNQADMLSRVDSVTGTMTTFLGAIAGISLFVGGIGIMNIMLVSVTERTREIGIRKAIGAKRKDILGQFLIESILISCTGGIIGILLGMSLVEIVRKVASMAAAITPSSVLTSFIVSAVVGVFFGIYPASKASKLNPIEALRFE